MAAPDSQPRIDGSYRPGTNWMPDRGKLYRFSATDVTVIQPWPLPQAWRRKGNGGWQGCHPHIDLRVVGDPLEPDGAELFPWQQRWHQAFEVDAWSQVPLDIRLLARRAALSGRQWQALCLAARCPQAQPLMEEIPLLAAGLAEVNLLRRLQGRPRLKRPWRAARSQAQAPWGWARWRALSGWLGLPSDAGFVRMLRRVRSLEGGDWTGARLMALAQAWQLPKGRKLLQHLPRMSGRIAAVFQTALLDPGILERLTFNLLSSPRDDQDEVTLDSTLALIAEVRCRFDSPPPLPLLRSLEQLEAVRDAVIDEWMERDETEFGSFPPPPLTGDDHIAPLLSTDALVQEGEEMGHCLGIGGWDRLCRLRLGFAYRVRVPRQSDDHALDSGFHRGTAWIVPTRTPHGGFTLEQLQGPGNQAPHASVVQAVQRWLSLHDQARMLREHTPSLRDHPALPPVPEASWLAPREDRLWRDFQGWEVQPGRRRHEEDWGGVPPEEVHEDWHEIPF